MTFLDAENYPTLVRRKVHIPVFKPFCRIGTTVEGSAGLMMKTSWKFGPHGHNYMSTGQHGPVGQRNPLRQVMWVSNPLEGYRIPVSAVRCLSALSKTLTGPRAKACQATRQSDGGPTPWCAGPWPSPTHCHWGCTLRGLPSLQHNPDVRRSAWMRWGVWEYTHMFGVWMCQQRLNADEDIPCLVASGALTLAILTGKFTRIPKPWHAVPEERAFLTLRAINEKANGRLPEERPLELRHVTAWEINTGLFLRRLRAWAVVGRMQGSSHEAFILMGFWPLLHTEKRSKRFKDHYVQSAYLHTRPRLHISVTLTSAWLWAKAVFPRLTIGVKIPENLQVQSIKHSSYETCSGLQEFALEA